MDKPFHNNNNNNKILDNLNNWDKAKSEQKKKKKKDKRILTVANWLKQALVVWLCYSKEHLGTIAANLELPVSI